MTENQKTSSENLKSTHLVNFMDRVFLISGSAFIVAAVGTLGAAVAGVSPDYLELPADIGDKALIVACAAKVVGGLIRLNSKQK